MLVLEAGPANRNPLFRIPILGPALGVGSERLDWRYKTQPDNSRGGLSQDWPRGKMLGGSSRLNGMVYVRGASADYDQWRDMGCTGWGWNEVRPFFERFERITQPDNVHGANGDLAIHRLTHPHPLSRAFVDAHREIGVYENQHYNSGHQEGAAILVSSNDGHWRADGKLSHLGPARNRPNLKVMADVLVDRLVFEGKRCVGVEYIHQGKARQELSGREVILCAGAIATPALLMRSGVGPAAHLQNHGIPVVMDNSNVGSNLHEHPAIQLVANSRTKTISTQDKPWHLPGHLYDWWMRKGGLMSAASYEAISFLRSDKAQAAPDIQLHFSPYGLERTKAGLRPTRANSFMIQTNLSYPKSRGRIRLKSASPQSDPLIEHEMFADPDDLQRLATATKLAIELFGARCFKEHFDGIRLPENLSSQSNDFSERVRQHAVPAYHPGGTCAMGTNQKAAVDPALRLKGLDAIRVADASTIPTPVSGNSQASVLMIAEKASKLVQDQG